MTTIGPEKFHFDIFCGSVGIVFMRCPFFGMFVGVKPP